MRILNLIILIPLILISLNNFAQHNNIQIEPHKSYCQCEEDSFLKGIISCDTMLFKNGAKIYRHFNCDSSWLIFENIYGEKITMNALRWPLIQLTERLGYQFEKEYRNTLLFQNRQASGCCFPINFELINKDNGQVMQRFGTIIYHSDDTINNFVLYFSNSLDTISFYNIESHKEYKFALPSGRIEKTIRESRIMFPEFLFEEPKKEHNTLVLEYKYLTSLAPEIWNTDKIIIELKKTKR